MLKIDPVVKLVPMKIKLIPTTLPHCDRCIYKNDWSAREPGARYTCLHELTEGCRDDKEGIKYYYAYVLPVDFKPIASAPRDGTHFIGITRYGEELNVHYACDFSGEEQPPFEGFFDKDYMSAGPLAGWKELEEV